MPARFLVGLLLLSRAAHAAAFASKPYFFTKNCRQQSRQQVTRSWAERNGTQLSRQLRVKDPAAHGVLRSHVADGSARQVAVAASSRGRLAATVERQSASSRKGVVVMVARCGQPRSWCIWVPLTRARLLRRALVRAPHEFKALLCMGGHGFLLRL